MADTNLTDLARRVRIAKLYDALTEKNKYVGQILGSDPPEHPLKKISNIYDNTFLHMAIRFKEKDLVNELLQLANGDNRTVLSNEKNNEGNTILHEVATSDTMQDVAEKMLEIDPQLLIARNKLGETPIFCAARYGQPEMFDFLADKLIRTVSLEVAKSCLRRTDRTTVLHISIFSECFGLAYFIAVDYPDLIKEMDQDSMTALQYMACNPNAFEMQKMKKRPEFMEAFIKSEKRPAEKRPEQKEFKEFMEIMEIMENMTNSCLILFMVGIRALMDLFDPGGREWVARRKKAGVCRKNEEEQRGGWGSEEEGRSFR